MAPGPLLRAFLMVKQCFVLGLTFEDFRRLKAWATCQQVGLVPVQDQTDAFGCVVFEPLVMEAGS